MQTLQEKKCEVCEVGAAPVTALEIENLTRQIPEWQI